jgi:hypothetical protein
VIKVTTQAQLDKALKKTNGGKDELVVCIGSGRFVLPSVGRDNCSIVGRDNCSIVGWGNCSIVGRDNCSIEGWGNCSIVGRDNCSIVGRGNCSARALSARCSIKATKSVVVMRHHPEATISGGRILEMPRPETGEEWCEFYGVEIRKGGNFSRKLKGQDVAILFKALGENFVSSRGMSYEPGSAPEAPDWDGGKEECGGGLHFSPHPKMAQEFNSNPAHFVACPVLVSEIVVHPDGSMPQKVKAPRVCAPCWEVDSKGERVEEKAKAAA